MSITENVSKSWLQLKILQKNIVSMRKKKESKLIKLDSKYRNIASQSNGGSRREKVVGAQAIGLRQ